MSENEEKMLFDIGLPHNKLMKMLEQRCSLLSRVLKVWEERNYERAFQLIDQ